MIVINGVTIEVNKEDTPPLTARWIAESSKGPDALSVDMIESYIIDLVQIKCKEQREICARDVCAGEEEAVLRAPEPEIG